MKEIGAGNLSNENGRRAGAILGAVLITECEQADRQLQLSLDFLHGLVNRIADPVVVKDDRHRFMLVNDAECALVGQTRAMLLGKTDYDFFPKEQVEVFWAIDDRVLETGEAILNEEVIKHGSTGETLTIMTHKTRYVDQTGNRFVIAVIRDITERKRAENELRQSEERAHRQRKAFEILSAHETIGLGDVHASKRMLAELACRALQVERSSVWLLSADGKELQCIELFESLTGKHSEGIVLRTGDYPRYFEAIRNQSRIAAGDARNDPRTSEFTQGYLIPLNIASMLDAMIFLEEGLSGVVCFEHTGTKRQWHADEESFASAIASLMAQAMGNASRKQAEAERFKLEVQNRQLQKAESLGRMAGAIAHHFNNQLMTVMLNLEVGMKGLPRNARPYDNLGEAMQAARKASEVSRLMMTYLGQTNVQLELLDLAEACLRGLPMFRAAAPEGVVWDVDLPAPGPFVQANANQIHQVLTNLLTNAWEASNGGRSAIRLSVKAVAAANIPAAKRFPVDFQLKEDAYACLEVADKGCGMKPHELEKLFDPFFTSKFTGRGLGLPVVLGIVRAHQGAVTVESEPGQGSVFRVFLPLSAEALA